MQTDPIITTALSADELVARGGRPRDEAREQAILDAVIELVAEVGYERLTVDGVATRAHASKATIYRRWPGKPELVVDAFKRRVAEPLTIPDLGSLRSELDHGMALMCAHIAGMDGNLLCGLAGASQSDPDLAACFKRMVEEKDSPLGAVVDRAVARGELPAGSTPLLIEEVTVAVALTRALKGEALDAPFARHLVEDIALPLLTLPLRTAPPDCDSVSTSSLPGPSDPTSGLPTADLPPVTILSPEESR